MQQCRAKLPPSSRRAPRFDPLQTLAAGVLAAASCSPRHQQGSELALTESGLCSELRAAAWQVPAPAEALEPPPSQLTATAAITTERVRSELARRIPVQLASVRRQPIGRPGRVSYRIRRRGFALSLQQHSLVVSTEVSAEIEVCKPLGPLCVTYGRCRPVLHARAGVPLLLDDDYRLGRSHVTIRVTRPCNIAGYDATPEIQKQARQQATRVQSQIDASLPALRPQLQQAWQHLHTPLRLSEAACLRLGPKSVVQSQPKLDDGQLVLRAALDLEPRVQDPCSAGEASGAVDPGLPSPRNVDSLPAQGWLYLPFLLDWTGVSAELAASLSGKAGGGDSAMTSRPRIIRAQSAQLAGGPAVALRLGLPEEGCDPIWLVAQPWYDAQAGAIRLRQLRPSATDLAAAATEQVRAVAATIAQHARLSVPKLLGPAEQALQDAVARLRKHQPPQAQIEIQLAPLQIDRVVAAPAGLAVVAATRTSMQVRLP